MRVFFLSFVSIEVCLCVFSSHKYFHSDCEKEVETIDIGRGVCYARVHTHTHAHTHVCVYMLYAITHAHNNTTLL